MHSSACQQVEKFLSILGVSIEDEESLRFESPLTVAKAAVARFTSDYNLNKTESLRKSLSQWKLQLLKAHYVSLVASQIIDETSDEFKGKWICLDFANNGEVKWNGQYFDDQFDAIDACIDGPHSLQTEPVTYLEVQIGHKLNFLLKSYQCF